MKLAVILVIFSVLIVAMVQAAPVGPNAHTLGVRFKDLYAAKVAQLKKIHKGYVSQINEFNEQLPKAAAKDGTEVPEFLEKWNNRYKNLVGKLNGNTKKLDKAVKNLNKFLSS
ncbi:11236_t:CDS:1 [Paraglomus brasilianum]|uniref:11236_t:CDS:1 n=1 Tax=Paraglomus brasilianum TaxID=144538 RepID=A0A9N9BMB7_9GLOM|nr:11236_t:CDS:1 [Paraglomus brasilianum]